MALARSGPHLFQLRPLEQHLFFPPQTDAPAQVFLYSCCSGILIQRPRTLRSPFVPASVRARKFFHAKWMPLQQCTFDLLALSSVQRPYSLRSPFVPASVRARKFFHAKWMPLQRCTFDPAFQCSALTRSGLHCAGLGLLKPFFDTNGCRSEVHL